MARLFDKLGDLAEDRSTREELVASGRLLIHILDEIAVRGPSIDAYLDTQSDHAGREALQLIGLRNAFMRASKVMTAALQRCAVIADRAGSR